MLNDFKASNGIILQVKTPVHEIKIYQDDECVGVVNLLHSEFERGVYRSMFGEYSREIRKALKEYAESLGITLAVRENIARKTKKLKS